MKSGFGKQKKNGSEKELILGLNTTCQRKYEAQTITESFKKHFSNERIEKSR